MDKAGRTKDGQKITAMFHIRDTALNELVREGLDGILDVALCFESRNGHLTNERELTKGQKCKESLPDHAEIRLLAPALHDRQSFRTLALLKIVRKGDSTNDVKAITSLRRRIPANSG